MAFTAEYIYRIIDKYSAPLTKITNKTKKLTGQMVIAGMSADKFNKKLRRLGRSMMNIGRQAMLRVSAPIAALGVVAGVTFARLEKGLINVNNLLSKKELKKYAGTLERLQEEGIKAGFVIDDTNKGLFDTISAMGASEKAFQTFDMAQKLAIGGATELGVAVNGLTSILAVYAKDNVTAADAANAFFSAQVKGKTTVRELSDNVGAVAPIARVAGVGYQELLATMTALTLGGLRTDNATTALRGAFNALVKPQENAAKAMDALGIIYGGVNIKNKGITASFRSIKVALEKYGIDAVAKSIPNIRAFTAVTAMSDLQLRKVQETIVKIQSDMKSGDGLMRAWKDQTLSLAWTFARAKGMMTIAFKRFVKVFAPELKLIIASVGKLIYKISELPNPIKKVIITLLALTAILPIVLLLLGGIAFMLPALTTAWTWMTIAAGAGLGLISAYLWPIALVVLTLAQLFDMYKQSERFRQSIANIGIAFAPIGDALTLIYDLLARLFGFAEKGTNTWIETWGNNLALVINFVANTIAFIVDNMKILGGILGILSGTGFSMENLKTASKTVGLDYVNANEAVYAEGSNAAAAKAFEPYIKTQSQFEGFLQVDYKGDIDGNRGVDLTEVSKGSNRSGSSSGSSGGGGGTWKGFGS